MLIFIIGIVMFILLVVSAITNTLLYFTILFAIVIVAATIAKICYRIKENKTKRNGRHTTGTVVHCKQLFATDHKTYYEIKFKYVDDFDVERTRKDIVKYNGYQMMMLDLEEEGDIHIMVYKNFAVTLSPEEIEFLEKREAKERKKQAEELVEESDETHTEEYHENTSGQKLKECIYCGYKTYNDEFKCPMCGGELDFKKPKKRKKKAE